MPETRLGTRVLCPFYQYDQRSDTGRYQITCEGLTERSVLRLIYRRKKDFTIQTETFCCRHYDRCEVYRMLMSKYEEEL